MDLAIVFVATYVSLKIVGAVAPASIQPYVPAGNLASAAFATGAFYLGSRHMKK